MGGVLALVGGGSMGCASTQLSSKKKSEKVEKSSGATVDKVLFAGVAFTGDEKHREKLYKWADQLAREKTSDGISVLDASLKKAMGDFKSEKLKLDYTQADDTKTGTKVSLAFVLGGETVEFVEFESEVIAIFRVMTRIVVFDWEEKKLIANFPLQIVHQEASPSKLSTEQQGKIFRRLYTDTQWHGNIFRNLRNKLESTDIREKYRERLGVRNVKIESSVQEKLQQAEGDRYVYQSVIAQTLESVLSFETGIALVPYLPGEAIAKTMALRFSNAKVFNLSLPDVDYGIDFTVVDFRSAERLTGRVRQIFFGSYAKIEVYLNDNPRVKYYFSENIRHVNQMALSTQETVNIDYWSAYQTSLRALMVGFAKLANQFDPKVAKFMSPTKDMKRSFEELKPIVESGQ